MQRYYILLKATGAGGWPGWLPYRLDADSAEQAVEKAKEQAENHYPEYEKFEVQAIEIERNVSTFTFNCRSFSLTETPNFCSS